MNSSEEKKLACETDVLVRCMLDLLHKRGYITNTCFFKALQILEEEKKGVTKK